MSEGEAMHSNRVQCLFVVVVLGYGTAEDTRKQQSKDLHTNQYAANQHDQRPLVPDEWFHFLGTANRVETLDGGEYIASAESVDTFQTIVGAWLTARLRDAVSTLLR